MGDDMNISKAKVFFSIFKKIKIIDTNKRKFLYFVDRASQYIYLLISTNLMT